MPRDTGSKETGSEIRYDLTSLRPASGTYRRVADLEFTPGGQTLHIVTRGVRKVSPRTFLDLT